MLSEGKMESKKRGGQFDPFWDGQFDPFWVRKLPFSGVVSLFRFEVVSLSVFSSQPRNLFLQAYICKSIEIHPDHISMIKELLYDDLRRS